MELPPAMSDEELMRTTLASKNTPVLMDGKKRKEWQRAFHYQKNQQP